MRRRVHRDTLLFALLTKTLHERLKNAFQCFLIPVRCFVNELIDSRSHDFFQTTLETLLNTLSCLNE
ncbi:Uncharacterised protein [Vibrio cholerae]|nr:Uncharacterised protein [Vibrio cholerae]CSI26018.1 Uncharacterised protein [Vibrio cholerae]